ncbi:MAG: catalase [Thermoanaerobaculia bacterium]
MAKRTGTPTSGDRSPSRDRKSGAKGRAAEVDLKAAITEQEKATQALAAAFPFNPNKGGEFGPASGTLEPGVHRKPGKPSVGASTVTEVFPTPKTGAPAQPGQDPGHHPLEASRSDSSGQTLTTNFGVPVADNQNSLKAGLRGPTLMEDFILREKITHFDHERIPERIVHARGSGAHGVFECYAPLDRYTRASFLGEAGKRTPVFVRFSTVAGERGSTDTARDIRGFATKFYTDEGNFDLVGNNIPVFFIQDAMKFPDLVHAVKPEPNNGMPQAASAHDTFWDFVSLMPETSHVLMWAMSDRALPRSFRTMQGFGVHTFRLVNAKGDSHFVKFHWTPLAGTHSLDWDECVKLSGADSDFHRRDLWDSIEQGVFPEYELGLQIFTESQAEAFSFDVLDATKLVPEELVPVQAVGRMTLLRNPDNFFAETEQVAFGVQNLVPGLDFSNDPLLAGRIHSYFDTQLSRLGGPNFHQIPINAALAPVHNNQRDGMHRQTVPRGRVAYEPNSLGGGCPFQAGAAGFTSFAQPLADDKVRGKPEKFADHYSQATLFWNSQTAYEQAHIVRGFRFELTKLTVPAIRVRTLSMLRNVSEELASKVAEGLGLGLPEPMPTLVPPPKVEIESSPALSLTFRPGDGGVRGRKIALIVADGIDRKALSEVETGLQAAGAKTLRIGVRLGRLESADGTLLDIETTFETMPSVLFDATVLPEGGAENLASLGQVREFLKDQYRHCKAILVPGDGADLATAAEIPLDDKRDWGIQDNLEGFIEAVGKHRNWDRAADPPPL